MQILFFADTHLGFDFPIHPRIQRRRRGIDFYTNYARVLEHAKTDSIPIMIHGGDLFFRSKLPGAVIQKAYEPLLSVLEAGIDTFIVPGNHERSKLPATPLFKHPRLHVFDRPRTFVVSRGDQTLALGGFPNIRNDVQRRFGQAFLETGLQEARADHKILCLHQVIEGAVVGVQKYRFPAGPEVIGRSQFPTGLDLILSGHIHRAQEFSTPEGTPILYPGSIERTSFMERAEPKGYLLITLGSHHPRWEFVPLPTRPMVQLQVERHLTTKQDLLRHLTDVIPSLPEEAVIQVKVQSAAQLGLVSASELRSLFPPSMNVDLAFSETLSTRLPLGGDPVTPDS